MRLTILRRGAAVVVLFAICSALNNFASADLVRPDDASRHRAHISDILPSGVVTGSGIVQLPAERYSAWHMDGALRGDTPETPIVLNGFVKGSGTFDNVVFDGTFSPGHSPALVTLGNTIYTASNVLEIELGGLLPGSQHDKVVHNGNATAGGALDVVLINAFVPQLGNAFDIFDWNAGLTGTFATVNLPPLNAGLAWDASDLYLGGQLVVTTIPEASAFWLMVVSTLLLVIATFIRPAWKSSCPTPLVRGIE
jgi:hypothetical protein